MKARFRSLLASLGLFAVALAVTCGGAEIGLRLIRPQPLEAAYVWADGTLRHRPSFTYTYARRGFSNTVSFNSLGMRGPEIAEAKTPGIPRVFFMGDSFVEGKQVADDEVITAVLARLSEDGGAAMEVINAGVAGYGTDEELILWEKVGRSLDPDIVILGFYPNDVRNNVERKYFVVKNGEVVQRRQPRLPKVRWIYDFRKRLAAHSHVYMLMKMGKKAWRSRGEETRRGAGEDSSATTATFRPASRRPTTCCFHSAWCYNQRLR